MSRDVFKICLQETPTKWQQWLSLSKYWYNTSYHSTLGCTSYKALYRTEPYYGLLPDLTTTSNSMVVGILAVREAYFEFLKQQLAKAQLHMK